MRPIAFVSCAFAALALYGCSADPAPAPAETDATMRVTVVDRLGVARDTEPVEEGDQNVVQVRNAAGGQVARFEWGLREDGVTESLELPAGTYTVRAEALDYFAAEDGRLVEECELAVEPMTDDEEEAVVYIDRNRDGRCDIERDPALCPQPGTKPQGDDLLARASAVLRGLERDVAERIAAASGCHLAAAGIDGEPQPLTREYDPTRIAVDLEADVVARVRSFG